MELYHVLNRGVEKRDIFLDDRDRFRFVHGLGLFNTKKSANNSTYLIEGRYNDFVSRYGRDPIVEIHAWCLMKNHYHLLLSESVENGITAFIRKLNIGYAKYFNKRRDRSGYLFQGRTKKIHIHSSAHFFHILHYIHLNPLDYVPGAREWRNGQIKDVAKAKMQLEKYRWSSYADYRGHKNFPSILAMDFFKESIGNVERQTMLYIEKPGKLQDILPDRFLE